MVVLGMHHPTHRRTLSYYKIKAAEVTMLCNTYKQKQYREYDVVKKKITYDDYKCVWRILGTRTKKLLKLQLLLL
jgi:hypothetical protein